MPQVSVIMSVYNAQSEEILRTAIESICSQTFLDFEFIICDDGSTDDTSVVCHEYSKIDSRIRYIKKKNGGVSSARNEGIRNAKGEYITFVDTDDYVEPDWAEKLYNAAKENNADMAVCGFERIDLKTNKVVGKDMTKQGNTVKEITSEDDFMVFVNPAPWNKIYKREKVKDLRFLPFRGFNDAMFLTSAFIRINKIAFVPDILYHYYLRSDSQIHSVNEQDVKNLKKYLLKVKELYQKEGKYEEMGPILEMMAFLHLAVSVMYRASYNPDINIKKMTKETREYLDTNFSEWRKNKFLTFRYSITRGVKHLGLYVIALLYKMNLQMLYIRAYRFVVDKIKVDIKF